MNSWGACIIYPIVGSVQDVCELPVHGCMGSVQDFCELPVHG